MQKTFISLIIFFLFSANLFSQENAPHIKGKVKISVTEGTFECDITMSDIPRIDDYLIRLNTGMNLLHIRSKKPNDFVLGYDISDKDSASTGESLAYYFPDNTGKSKFLPEELQFRYVGKFPVAKDTIQNYSRFDWKGNIAFNGYSVRTDGFQTAWIPYLYDAKNDIAYSEIVYDIELTCEDCSTLYINGSKPVSGTYARFTSNEPYEPALFCGKFNFEDDGNITILNSKYTKDETRQFSNLISSFKKYYEQKLNIKFDQSPIFIKTTPTSINNAWLFVTYPTIVSIGWGKYNTLESLLKQEVSDGYKQFIAHELGHYYFGTYKVFNSTLGDMMSEGFSEYMSLKLMEDLVDAEPYNKKLTEKFESLKNFNDVCFYSIKSITDIKDRETFVYNYAPIIFTAIEKEIGKNKMWEWLKNILDTKIDFTDYQFLTSTLKNTLKDDKQFYFIENTYFKDINSTKNALDKIRK
ncbi:MAG: hypothetical protein LBE36_09810 [Flavobacteriaceae bacterium]|jgi:hypothetical protein|nr:hypothetical protein [Flavobacteriaceae bacterium]